MSRSRHSGVSPSIESPPVFSNPCAFDANGSALQRGDECVNHAPHIVTTGGNTPPMTPQKNLQKQLLTLTGLPVLYPPVIKPPTMMNS